MANNRCTQHHPVVFVLTFMSYAFFHATRKTFSNVKTTISDEWTPSFHNETVNETQPDYLWNKRSLFENKKDAEPYLGILDAVFMTSYAVGLYISGMVGDRLNMRLVLTFGMCSSAISVFIFGGLLEWTHYYNKYIYVLIWILNGLLQSTGWPTVVAVMGNWFGRSSRGFVLGLWSACASVGNIIGALMVSAVLDYGYDYAFLLTSGVLFAGGVINFFGLVTTPKELGLPVPDEDNSAQVIDYTVQAGETEDLADGISLSEFESNSMSLEDPLLSESAQKSSLGKRQKALGFFSAVCLPGVALYALSYACLKLVNYSFFFWLPYYLHNKYGWKETVADDISIWYDVGGIIGGTLFGFISDRFQKRSVIVIPMLILAIPSLFIYNSHLSATLTMNGFLMSVVGFFIGGVANLISAAISADLGRQGPIQGNSEALATVTGIIDGTGSVGAAIGQILVPFIQDRLGWQSVFYLFMLLTLMTAVCIMPLFVREMKSCCADYTFSWYHGFHRKLYIVRLSQEEEEENDFFSEIDS